MKSHSGRNSEHLCLALDHGLHDACSRSVGAEVIGIPALHLEEVSHRSQAELMQFARDARGNHRVAHSFSAEDAGIQLRHNELCGCGAIMLMRDADSIHLPKAPNLTLRALKNVQVNVFWIHASID